MNDSTTVRWNPPTAVHRPMPPPVVSPAATAPAGSGYSWWPFGPFWTAALSATSIMLIANYLGLPGIIFSTAYMVFAIWRRWV